jgi:hypothetical protein
MGQKDIVDLFCLLFDDLKERLVDALVATTIKHDPHLANAEDTA